MLLKGTFCPYSVDPAVPKDLRSNAAVGFYPDHYNRAKNNYTPKRYFLAAMLKK